MGTSGAKRKRRKKRHDYKDRANESRRSEALDSSLRLILDSLAQLLLTNGYGFTRFARHAKLSFVKAARSINLEAGHSISKARIAALTGLTRTEVSELLRRGEHDLAQRFDSTNRTLRVVKGWLTDTKFLDSDSAPRKLEFRGGSSSFSHLVKKYSGDIPARAMLAEMKRLQIVRHDSRDSVSLVRTRLPVPRTTMLAMKAISPWVEMLASGIDADQLGEVTSRIKQTRLTFNSGPQLLAAVREL